MIKGVGYKILILIMVVAAMLTPWLTEGKYNQDLLVLVIYMNTVVENITFWESVGDNSSFVYLLRVLFENKDPKELIFIAHNVSVVMLAYTLNRYLRPIYTLSILLFCFFTIFLNQFRLAFALSFGILAFFESKKNNYIEYILLTLCFFCHFFVFGWFMLFKIWNFYRNSNNAVRVLIVTALISSIAYGSSAIQNLRFVKYFSGTESYVSFSFVLIGVILYFSWKTIRLNVRPLVLMFFLGAMVLSFLPAFSSRVSEMLLITIPIVSPVCLDTNRDFRYENRRYRHFWHQFFILIICFVFFSYRYNNLVVKDNTIEPEILDNLFYEY